jgi:hypothetical protein
MAVVGVWQIESEGGKNVRSSVSCVRNTPTASKQ